MESELAMHVGKTLLLDLCTWQTNSTEIDFNTNAGYITMICTYSITFQCGDYTDFSIRMK